MRTVGYIVFCTFNPSDRIARPMELGSNSSGLLKLYFGDRATLFDTYDQARNAIRRTIRDYNSVSSTEGVHWDFHKSFGRPSIMRVTKP